MLLSFTKKTVDELNERLTKIGVATKATTFHKLGYDTIKKHRADMPAVTNENTLSGVIKVSCPDFYLKKYDIYLEHFGVDEAYDWTGGFIELPNPFGY